MRNKMMMMMMMVKIQFATDMTAHHLINLTHSSSLVNGHREFQYWPPWSSRLSSTVTMAWWPVGMDTLTQLSRSSISLRMYAASSVKCLQPGVCM